MRIIKWNQNEAKFIYNVFLAFLLSVAFPPVLFGSASLIESGKYEKFMEKNPAKIKK